jgi:hypothetical protein
MAGVALAMAACATTPPEAVDIDAALQKRGFKAGEAVDRIQRFRIDDWRYLDASHVIVGAGPSSNYLLTLMGRCNGLMSTEDLGFSTTAGDLTTLDKIVIQSSTAPQESCPIKEIRKLEALPKEDAKK